MAQKSATVAICNNNKLLILRRGQSAPWKPGHYCLPGGKKEGDESLVDCAIRELKEETGITISDKNTLTPHSITYNSAYSKIVFFTKLTDPSVRLNWEHDHYIWLDHRSMSNFLMVPGLPTTIRYLVANGLLM